MKRKTHGRLVLSLLAILAVALLSGCGGSGDSAQPADTTTQEQASEPAEIPLVSEIDYEALLTPADVESVSGLSGLMTVPYDPSIGAGGDVNIAEADGQLVVMLIVEGPEYYEIWKGDGQTFLRAYTPVVGEESFIGPVESVTPDSYIFGFRTESYSVVVDTFFRVQGVTKILSVEQLAELAGIVESRL